MSERENAKLKRTRLAPHERRMQLLDAARRFIEANGLASLTMDEIAKDAGVSIPLIYKYFDTRMQLLHELLIREFNRHERDILDRVAPTRTYRDIVEVFVRVNFEQAERSSIIEILRSQPDISATLEQSTNIDLQRIDRLLVKGAMREFKISSKLAAQIVATSSGASQAAARHRILYGGNKNKMIKETVDYIFSGIETLVSQSKQQR